MKGHPIQPTVEELLALTGEYAQRWSVRLIYLATEETDVVERFMQAFPGRVVTSGSMRHEPLDGFDRSKILAEVRFDRKDDKYMSGLEYLTDMALLSRCDYYLGTLTSGPLAALFMNGDGYKDKHIIDLGVY
jgi:hypothetical protein